MRTIMRFIITIVWSTIYCLIIGFIASSLTQMSFNLTQSAIIGAIFGFFYALIIPTITARSVKDKSKFSKL